MSGIPFRSLRAYREHKNIVDLIVAGDGDGAAHAMRHHVNSVLELDASGASVAGRTASEATT